MEVFAYKFRGYLRHHLMEIIEMSNRLIRGRIGKEIALKIFNIYRYLEELVDPHIHLILPFFCESFLTVVSDLTD